MPFCEGKHVVCSLKTFSFNIVFAVKELPLIYARTCIQIDKNVYGVCVKIRIFKLRGFFVFLFQIVTTLGDPRSIRAALALQRPESHA